MTDVNWSGVKAPEAPEEEKSGGWLGTIIFIVLMIFGILAGGSYLNFVLLGDRVRDLGAAECPDASCIVDVRTAHDDCYLEHASWGVPGSLEAFQAPKSSPKLGIGTVDFPNYLACVLPHTKTLAEQEAE